jgi:hypothetical protein
MYPSAPRWYGVARQMDEQQLTWIFGSSRSGSTWLLRMLSELEGVVPIDDPHLGHHLGVWRPIPLAWATVDGDLPELTTLLELKAQEPGYFILGALACLAASIGGSTPRTGPLPEDFYAQYGAKVEPEYLLQLLADLTAIIRRNRQGLELRRRVLAVAVAAPIVLTVVFGLLAIL